MIAGAVSESLEAILPLRLRGPNGTELNIDAVIDTGFNGSLTLPVNTIARLGLQRVSGSGAMLADGSVLQFDVFAAELDWESNWRPLLVAAVGNEPLVGMRLLVQHELRIVVRPGGAVEITPLC